MSSGSAGNISADDLARLLHAIEESKLLEVEIDYAGLHLRVRKDGVGESTLGEGALQDVSKRSGHRNEPMAKGMRRIEVCAPMLGVFYRAPQPGAPPFVQLGQSVGANDTIGLIEVMKLFNQVPAGVEGRVVEVIVEDGAFVEHGQVLLIVEAQQ
jgi:acetyl-CoA carboxylase biotin carboxyl carrier protein